MDIIYWRIISEVLLNSFQCRNFGKNFRRVFKKHNRTLDKLPPGFKKSWREFFLFLF